MSQYSEIMQALDDIKVQNSWLVQAVKYLLATDVDLDLDGFEGDLALDDEYEPAAVPDHIAVRRPKVPKAKPCPHNQQVLVDGNVTCARCGFLLNRSGVRGKDPNSPVPQPGMEDVTFNHGTSV